MQKPNQTLLRYINCIYSIYASKKKVGGRLEVEISLGFYR